MAIFAGYRTIDTSLAFQNEEVIGAAIKELIDEGVIKRQDIFICARIWTRTQGNLENQLQEILIKLQVDNVDIFICHPVSTDIFGNFDMCEKDFRDEVSATVDTGLAKDARFEMFDTSIYSDMKKSLANISRQFTKIADRFRSMNGHQECSAGNKIIPTFPTEEDMSLIGKNIRCLEPVTAKTAWKMAINAGYRFIDTALAYQNEEVLGVAIKELIEEGFVRREDISIRARVWIRHNTLRNFVNDLKKILRNLQISYVDILICHTENTNLLKQYKTSNSELLKELNDSVDIGLTKFISLERFHFSDSRKMKKSATRVLNHFTSVSNSLKNMVDQQERISSFIDVPSHEDNIADDEKVDVYYEETPANRKASNVENIFERGLVDGRHQNIYIEEAMTGFQEDTSYVVNKPYSNENNFGRGIEALAGIQETTSFDARHTDHYKNTFEVDRPCVGFQEVTFFGVKKASHFGNFFEGGIVNRRHENIFSGEAMTEIQEKTTPESTRTSHSENTLNRKIVTEYHEDPIIQGTKTRIQEDISKPVNVLKSSEPTMTLSNGKEMPLLTTEFGPYSTNELKEITKKAMRAGCRRLQTSSIYKNEESVGETIKELIKDNFMKRDDVSIEAVVYTRNYFYLSVAWDLIESLKKLQLKFVDVLIIRPVCIEESSPAMEQMKKELDEIVKCGLAKDFRVEMFVESDYENAKKRVVKHWKWLTLNINSPESTGSNQKITSSN